MNKQEAIEKIEKEKSSLNAWEDLTRNRALNDALAIVRKIDEPQKVVVPKFVGEWIESQKESFSDASAIDMYDNLTLDNSNGYYHEVWLWVIAHHHDFIKAWHDGYTVEQEKLYTVEIPNPNGDGYGVVYLGRNEYNKTELRIWDCYSSIDFADNWKQKDNAHLTESEIKEDFGWAWQFAKEVEE